jgi:hypothetical protein
MQVSGSISIPSAIGTSTVITVTGEQALAYARLLQSYLDDSLSAGRLNLALGVDPGDSTTFSTPIVGMTNEAVISANQDAGLGIGTTANIPAGYQAIFDNVNGASTVIGSGTSTDAIFAGVGAAATFIDNGGDNTIIFVNGNNLYTGDTVSSAFSNTILGGTGFDTINSGYGHVDIYAGVGRSLITTNDAAPVTSTDPTTDFNAYIYLADGQSTVNANGLKDAVISSAPGQLINTGLTASDYTGVVLLPVGTTNAADTVYAHAGAAAVFDFASGNTVSGGTGLLMFMGGTDISASVLGGAGASQVFGAAGDTITWTVGQGDQPNIFVAGAGNETLNAATSQGNLGLFGYSGSDPVINAQVSESMVGGAGNDTLVSGAGYETLVGGAGDNAFLICAQTDGVGAHITLDDFGASSNNLIAFSGYTQAEIDSALNGAHTVPGIGGQTDTVFTLSDNTTVTVVGIASLAGHTFGG